MTDTRPHTDTDRPADGNVASLEASQDPDVRELFDIGPDRTTRVQVYLHSFRMGRIAGLKEALDSLLKARTPVDTTATVEIAARIAELEAE